MLEIKNLNKSYGETKVLNNINLKLEKNKIFLIENGVIDSESYDDFLCELTI